MLLPQKAAMKLTTLLLLFLTGMSFAQPSYEKTKISQNLKADCSIASTSIVTKVFAKETNSDSWVKVYESEVAVAKNKLAKKAKEAEYQKAEKAAATFLVDKNAVKNPEPETVSEPVHER